MDLNKQEFNEGMTVTTQQVGAQDIDVSLTNTAANEIDSAKIIMDGLKEALANRQDIIPIDMLTLYNAGKVQAAAINQGNWVSGFTEKQVRNLVNLYVTKKYDTPYDTIQKTMPSGKQAALKKVEDYYKFMFVILLVREILNNTPLNTFLVNYAKNYVSVSPNVLRDISYETALQSSKRADYPAYVGLINDVVNALNDTPNVTVTANANTANNTNTNTANTNANQTPTYNTDTTPTYTTSTSDTNSQTEEEKRLQLALQQEATNKAEAERKLLAEQEAKNAQTNGQANTQTNGQADTQADTKQDLKSDSHIWLIVFIVIAVVIAGVVIWYAFFRSDDGSQPSDPYQQHVYPAQPIEMSPPMQQNPPMQIQQVY